MLYVRIKNNLPVEVSSEHQADGDWESRWDWKSFDEVSRLATYLTAMTGKTYLPADHGDGVSPRFDIIEAPRVGDKVSRTFNGDTYPAGEIVKITKGWQITTSTGQKFRQFRQSGAWREVRGSFWMLAGHTFEQNPHF
jgi:hypothetical protein